MDAQGAKAFILAKLRHELPQGRTYHSLEHTLDVYASSIGIAEREGVNGEGLTLLKIAALYHDSGFTEQDNAHEDGSCRIVRENLPRFGFTPEQVERVCNMIMCTCIPQTPKDLLDRILCDADLDYLGRNDFKMIGNTLFDEMRRYGVLKDEFDWNQLQVKFLESHRYFTETNKTLREPVKQRHLQDLRIWLKNNPKEN
jgi:predicted metal-dependent HD superfamily phosphohydrolase